MSKPMPSHIEGLLAYLSKPQEKANEDLAVAYFRRVFGETFSRQKEAGLCDGYVAGHFVLELKGNARDWLSGLFQGLAYSNQDLDFGQIVVAAKSFLAIWQVDQLPEEIRLEVLATKGAPSTIGKQFAKKYANKRKDLLKAAIWNGSLELFGTLFKDEPDVVIQKLKTFEVTLCQGRKVRQKITPKNFISALKEMRAFFNVEQPIKTVRAFYSMVYGWDETSTLQLSHKAPDQAAIGGEVITDLVPEKRAAFKEFVDNRAIFLRPNENHDDFFARFDEALDAVDKDFRIRHGIFFTDLDLSKFVMWLVKKYIPELGRNYLVIDPACGSGNLVTNWRSPLELRHKVVSEIEPELLFAVEKRMKLDSWHNGKFTVVPKISENRGLNFLDRSADDYLGEIRKYLEEKGHKPDKPLAFLCNPPYRNDDDQTADSISYKIHDSILSIAGIDGGTERYCCFLAQMKLICDAAKSSGLPGGSLLLLFTKSAWLTKRAIFESIRAHMLSSLADVTGVLINGSEFFDVKGAWPVAFTVWEYKGADANLDPHRSIQLTDLTWLKKDDLAHIPWDHQKEMDGACQRLVADPRSKSIEVGKNRVSIKTWAGQIRRDFMRNRRKRERDQKIVGGLPLGDQRQSNRKAYGEMNGRFIGFMDNLTPCRIKASILDRPWFRLNNQFMDVKKNRCFSGPPTHFGYCATDLEAAKKLFFWYALARVFTSHSYPMWVDADDMWEPAIPVGFEKLIFQTSFLIGYAENECLEVRFPANNPVKGSPQLSINNPMTPLHSGSFWSTTIRHYCDQSMPSSLRGLLTSTNQVFAEWDRLCRRNSELHISPRPYLLDNEGLTRGAGIIQIKDYAIESESKDLLGALSESQRHLKGVRKEFFEMVTSTRGLNYFGSRKESSVFALPEKTRFQRVLAKRMAVVGILVDSLKRDPNFGRTKLAKLFYLADVHEGLDLGTEYRREAAGPLDQRALYHESIGIESLARKYKLFKPEPHDRIIRYRGDIHLKELVATASRYLGDKSEAVVKIADLFRKLDTDQSEIIATLYACWNDLLLRKKKPADEDVLDEFLGRWHPKKARFSKTRLSKALRWMRENDLLPRGSGRPTVAKP